MKKLFTFLFVIAMASSAFGQMEAYLEFESEEDTTYWEIFANGAGTKANTISIVPNPAADAVNPSDNVLKFHVQPGCDNWVGMYADASAPGSHSQVADFALTDFTGEAQALAYMVYKERITDCGLKVERSLNGGETLNLYVPNTKTEEWELLTFVIPGVAGYYYERLTVFVDHFPEGETRPENDSTDVYIDNLGVPKEDNTSVQEHNGIEMMLYPTPATYRMGVVYPGMTAITLSDVMGRQIRTLRFPVTDSKVIETGDLSTGIYFVTADIQNGDRVTMRFMKK